MTACNPRLSAFGEILIDFTQCGQNEQGISLFAQNPGGAPANVCVGFSRLGGTSSFLGKVGDDMHGRLLENTLAKEGVSTDGLVFDPDCFTTLAFVSTDENGERSFSFARKPGADTQMRFDQMDLDSIADSDIFHVGSLSLTHNPSREATQKAAQFAKDKGILISYDPNYRASLWPDEETAIAWMRSFVPQADLMKISDEETVLLTGQEDPQKAAACLLEQGPRLAVITLGSEGSMAANKNGAIKMPGYRCKVADTNGAGDSFWSAVLYQVAKSGKQPEELSLEELKEMLVFANATAALTVQKPGAIPAMPTAAQVEEFLSKQQ